MTSKPASRSARATILAPRSCPSNPGLATTSRIFRSLMTRAARDGSFARPWLSEHGADTVRDAHDLFPVPWDFLPVEPLPVVRPSRDEVQVEVRHGLEGRPSIGLEQIEPVGIQRFPYGSRHLLRGHDGSLEILCLRLIEGGRVGLGHHQAVSAAQRIDVHEGERPLIIVDLGGRDLAVADHAKDAVGHSYTSTIQPWGSASLPYWMPTMAS